jgi:hypothetical protein
MKLFTFSGIRADIEGFNPGNDLINLAQAIINNWTQLPSNLSIPVPSYDREQNHFISKVNLAQISTELRNLLTLDASHTLNNEAMLVQEKYAERLLQESVGTETILILAHSQGTNICTHVLDLIADSLPNFFHQHTLRCVFFDPKVGVNKTEDLWSSLEPEVTQKIKFLYFQSQNDLLDNQGFQGRKFIDEYLIGDHLFVQGLDHTTICHWGDSQTPASLSYPGRRMLTSSDYHLYKKDYQAEVSRRNRHSSKGVRNLISRDTFLSTFAMVPGPATTPLLEFLSTGELSPNYQS